jgi:hypothetical protein
MLLMMMRSGAMSLVRDLSPSSSCCSVHLALAASQGSERDRSVENGGEQ